MLRRQAGALIAQSTLDYDELTEEMVMAHFSQNLAVDDSFITEVLKLAIAPLII